MKKSRVLIIALLLVLVTVTSLVLVSCESLKSKPGGFDSLTEFKDWISDHVQPSTTYIEDAFLAAYKVQQAGLEDGYLFGLDIDDYTDSLAVFVSVFIDDELYWWYVEDAEAYGSYGLSR